jgi:hypothetical protein
MQSPSKPQLLSVLSRQAVGVLLIVAGIVWAILRGLHGYSEMPVGIVYTLDQPPILTALVGLWLLARSRPR